MEPDKDAFLLRMIINYCDNIADAVKDFDLSLEKITENNGYRAMLAFFVQQIGETAGKLSDEFKEKHSDIEWRAIIGFRNRIVHAYGKVMPDILWDTVENDIPELKDYCANLIHDQS